MRAAILSVTLAACSSSPIGDEPTVDPCLPVVLVPPADATAAERESIAAAAALWNGPAGAALTLDDVEGAPRVPVVFRDAPLAFLGIYERGAVVVNRGVNDGRARSVVLAHELGHAFGLVHVSDARSVMLPGNSTVAPGAPDVTALSALWGGCQ